MPISFWIRPKDLLTTSLVCTTICISKIAIAENQKNLPETAQTSSDLVEPFTAFTLDKGELQIGTEINYGLSQNLMIGSDTIGTFVGIPTLYTKYKAFDNSKHIISVSARAIWLRLDVLASWARAKSHYKTLNAKLVRPGVIWTQRMSPRLKIHTYWTQGFGNIDAELSEEGKRRSWEQKHPGEIYEQGEEQIEPDSEADESEAEEISSNENQEKAKEQTSNIGRRTLELQSLFGLSTDRFQITGEIERKGGNKIILTSRIEKMHFEELKANSIRFTVAQQWHHSSFHFRLGIGMMYLTITGTDLDGEEVDETGVLPVTDLSFYWRF